MVKHIVMWRMAESEDKEQRAKDIKENLEALKGKIDVLVNIEVGLQRYRRCVRCSTCIGV